MSHAHNHGNHGEHPQPGQPLRASHETAATQSEAISLRRKITNGILCIGAAASTFSAAKGYSSDHESNPAIWAGATIGASIAINSLVFANPLKKLMARRKEHGSWLMSASERDVITHGFHDTAHSIITGGGYLMHAVGGATKVDQALAFALSMVGVQMFWPSNSNLRRSHNHDHGMEEQGSEPLVSKRRALLLAVANMALGGAGLHFGSDIIAGDGTHSSAAAVAEGVHNTGDGVYALQGTEMLESAKRQAHKHGHGHDHTLESEQHETKKSLLEKLRTPLARQIGVAALATAALIGSHEAVGNNQNIVKPVVAEQSVKPTETPKHTTGNAAPEAVTKQVPNTAQNKAPVIPTVTVQPNWGIYDVYAALNIPSEKRQAVLMASQKILCQKEFTYQGPDGLRITRTGKVPPSIISYTLKVAAAL